MHHRRARPTVRVISDDLTSDWGTPFARRMLTASNWEALHPLSELDHPLIRKCAESIGAEESGDNYVGTIDSSTSVTLLEIKTGQWRGGVWRDPETGVHWLVAAGLAKGGHRDHDDFYEQLKRAEDAGSIRDWLPTEQDRQLLKRETAARILTEWELTVQESVLEALRSVTDGGSARFDVPYPVAGRGGLAQVIMSVTPVREADYKSDEIEVSFETEAQHRGRSTEWQLIVRCLVSLAPPEQGWDRFGSTFANIAEPDAWRARADELDRLVATGELAHSEPGKHSHYSHARHLAGRTIAGQGVRALCGTFFVPTQDYVSLPTCPTCLAHFEQLPSA